MPLLGINLGKVGFLSKAEAGDFEGVLELVVKGEYRIDERMALEGTDPARRDDRPARQARQPRRRTT